jgi:hypothetical protein
MANTLATMITITTYGTWLRGDQRGWVDDGVTFPADPERHSADTRRMKYPPFQFTFAECLCAGEQLGRALIDRRQQHLLALTVQPWHVHFIVGATTVPINEIVKCAKDAVRYGMRTGRPIWTAGFDKRFCFDAQSLRHRVAYVERHNVACGWPPRPWDFIEASAADA